MRAFFSPAERRLLASLPPDERAVVEALMAELDAVLVDAGREEDDQTSLFDRLAA